MREWRVLTRPTRIRDLTEKYSDPPIPVGTVLCTDDGEALLVGDVNQLGGICDDCSERRPIVAILLPEGETFKEKA